MVAGIRSEQLARINPDSKPVLYLVLSVTTVIAAVAFAVSFAGLAAVSAWAQIPPRLSWALPVFVDGAILGFTIMILVFRARGESTLFAWVVLIAFTVISVGANGAHAYAEGAPDDWRTVIGSGLAGLAPAGLAVFIHGIARLLVATPSVSVSAEAGMGEGASASLAETVEEEAEGPEDDGPGGGLSNPDPVVEGDGAALNGEFEGDVQELHETTLVGASLGPNDVESDRGVSRDAEDERNDRAAVGEDSGEGAEVAAVEEKVAEKETEVLAASSGSGTDSESEDSREVLVERALTLRSEGMSHRKISEALEVPQSTIGRWLRQHKADVASGKHLRAVNASNR